MAVYDIKTKIYKYILSLFPSLTTKKGNKLWITTKNPELYSIFQTVLKKC